MRRPDQLLGMYLHLARASQMRRQPMVRDKLLVLPQLLPYLAAAGRSGLSITWKIVLVVELLGRPNGVGYVLNLYFQNFNVTGILAYGLAFAGLLLVAANTGFLAGPAVLANMATDKWMPHFFSSLSGNVGCSRISDASAIHWLALSLKPDAVKVAVSDPQGACAVIIAPSSSLCSAICLLVWYSAIIFSTRRSVGVSSARPGRRWGAEVWRALLLNKKLDSCGLM